MERTKEKKRANDQEGLRYLVECMLYRGAKWEEKSWRVVGGGVKATPLPFLLYSLINFLLTSSLPLSRMFFFFFSFSSSILLDWSFKRWGFKLLVDSFFFQASLKASSLALYFFNGLCKFSSFGKLIPCFPLWYKNLNPVAINLYRSPKRLKLFSWNK